MEIFVVVKDTSHIIRYTSLYGCKSTDYRRFSFHVVCNTKITTKNCTLKPLALTLRQSIMKVLYKKLLDSSA
jgi:hypothetical protein